MKLWISSENLEKKLKYKIYQNLSSGSQIALCRWRDVTKLIVAFYNFVNEPKNISKFPQLVSAYNISTIMKGK
jgi:hypothetical protein